MEWKKQTDNERESKLIIPNLQSSNSITEKERKKMNCGVISDQLNNHLRRTTTSTRRRSSSTTTTTTNHQVWFCVSFKIPHLNPKTFNNINNNLLMIQNQQVFFRSSSSSSVYRFRTKATIKEDTDTDTDNNFVLSSEDTDSSSFYQLLGISESGSVSEIKQAYKQLARKYHPDVSPPDRTEEYTKRFIQVQEAYEILSDPNRRAMYDRDLARGLLHLAFSSATARNKRYYHHHHQEGVDERSNWKNCWQTQLSGLKKKSMNRDSTNDNMSWGARMRRQRNEHSGELSCEFYNHSLGFLLEFI